MDISWILAIIIGMLGVYFIYVKIWKKKLYWEVRGVPTKKQSIFTYLKILYPSKTFLDYIVQMYKMCEGERYYGYEMMDNPILIVVDPEIINLVLVKDFSYFQDRNAPEHESKELMHAGLANITGDKWRAMRLKLTPTFTSGKMRMMFKQIKECSDGVAQFLKAKNGQDVETRDFLFKSMLNITASIAFGINADALNDDKEKENDFLNVSKKAFKMTFLLKLKFLLFILVPRLIKLLGITIADTEVENFFPKFIQGLIDYRRENNEKRNDFLQLLIDLKEKEQARTNPTTHLYRTSEKDTPINKNVIKDSKSEEKETMDQIHNLSTQETDVPLFSDHIIAAQAFQFVSTGSEISSTVLSFVFHYLAVHQDVQQKLQQEIDEVLSSHGFSYEAMKKMKYLEQILYEVLRLRTPGGLITRVCTQDYKLPGSDLVVEKGTIIQVPAIGLHMDAQYFPDPENFNPDRFEDMDSVPKGVFFPFGEGPRMCTAMRLAMLMMKVLITAVLRSQNVLQSEKSPLPLAMCKRSFTQQVQNGLWIKFEERKM